jgi:outer membrane protein assembly factor BamB
MGQHPTGGIFLSYRREETKHAAGRLADRITARFGASQVFMDIDSIPLGADFAAAITAAVSRCDVLLALIGPNWTSVVDDQGVPRLEDPDDFIVLEVRAALDRGIPVIPVLVDGATMPRRKDLPAALAQLPNRNAVRLDAETFRSDSGALLDALTTMVPTSSSTEGVAAQATPAGERDPTQAVQMTERSVDRRTVLRLAVGAVGILASGTAVVAVRRLGRSNSAGKRGIRRPRWAFDTGDAVYSSPAITAGVLYIGSTDSSLYALDAATGKQRWRYATDGAVTSSPAVDGGTVFVGSNDRKVHAVDAETGLGRWTFETGAAMHSSPAVVRGVVYIGCRDHNLYALDAGTGKERWRFTGGDWFNSSPDVVSGMVYVGCRDRNVYALDSATGKQRWRYTTRSTVDSSAAVDGGTVWIGGDDHAVYALSAQDGKWIWQFDAKGGVDSSPLFFDGVVYVGSDDANLYALDATTGRMRWSFATGNGIRSSPATFGGRVYVGSRDRSLYAVDAETGEKVWQFTADGPIDDSSPAVVGGLVYVGSLDHRVYALDI